MIKMQLGGVIKKQVGNKVYYPTVKPFEIFEDPPLSDQANSAIRQMDGGQTRACH